jgi:hypothetical protein
MPASIRELRREQHRDRREAPSRQKWTAYIGLVSLITYNSMQCTKDDRRTWRRLHDSLEVDTVVRQAPKLKREHNDC